MPHIHKFIDFTVGAFIIHKNKVLLVYHKKHKKWLAIGGHIELNEDPEEALYREIKEESGLGKSNITVLAKKQKINDLEIKTIFTPNFVDIHKISITHRHLEFRYFLKTKGGKIKLAKREHDHIKWFTEVELSTPKYEVPPGVRFYTKEALRLAKTTR